MWGGARGPSSTCFISQTEPPVSRLPAAEQSCHAVPLLLQMTRGGGCCGTPHRCATRWAHARPATQVRTAVCCPVLRGVLRSCCSAAAGAWHCTCVAQAAGLPGMYGLPACAALLCSPACLPCPPACFTCLPACLPACRGDGGGASGGLWLLPAHPLLLRGGPLLIMLRKPRAVGGHTRGHTLLPPAGHRCGGGGGWEGPGGRAGRVAGRQTGTSFALTFALPVSSPAGECQFHSPVWGPLKGQIERESIKVRVQAGWLAQQLQRQQQAAGAGMAAAATAALPCQGHAPVDANCRGCCVCTAEHAPARSPPACCACCACCAGHDPGVPHPHPHA